MPAAHKAARTAPLVREFTNSPWTRLGHYHFFGGTKWRFLSPSSPAWVTAALLDPPSLNAGTYNDCLAILTRYPEAFEDTFVFDVLSGFRFAPAIKIIGRTIGKIFNRLYTMFTEGDEHLRCHAWNILECVFNAKLFSLSIKVRLNAL